MHTHSDSDFLGPLSDPTQFVAPLALAGIARADAQNALRTMLLIRCTEEHIGTLVDDGQARCPCHLGIGQEAIATGVSLHLRNTDRVFGTHRSHGHYLALGGDLDALLAEVLGKATGCCKGMGGSMHLYGPDWGFHGSVPIVGATIPIAVGAALAAQMDGAGAVAVAYFGDGASEEGVFHEALNMASLYRLPVLLVCENNLYSSHLDIALRQPSDRIARFADAHHIPTQVVDGNDVWAVANAAGALLEHARNGDGPGFLEAVTYRWRGHVGPREDIDVGVRRKQGDLAAWKHRDPIRRLKEAMMLAGHLDALEYDALVQRVRERVANAVDAAFRAPYPERTALLDLVYTQDQPC